MIGAQEVGPPVAVEVGCDDVVGAGGGDHLPPPITPLGGKPVKVAEWLNGVTPDFLWRIPADKVGGYRCFRMPTTIGSFGERARDNEDCWIYLDDFAMASAEDRLPKYSE